MRLLKLLPVLFFLLFGLFSCKTYKQDILFQKGELDEFQILGEIEKARKNYLIQKGDYLTLQVFAENGFILVDPESQFNQNNRLGQGGFQQITYLVQEDGLLKAPVVGKVKVDSLTIDQAEERLETRYNEFYKGSFVKLGFSNRRVIVLGSNGGQVIPLPNENMTLPEVIALSGGINFGARGSNVRVIRGDLSEPEVYEVDLNTVQGMKASIVPIEPGDIIYIEPWRRPVFEALRDITPILSITSSVIAFVLLIQTL